MIAGRAVRDTVRRFKQRGGRGASRSGLGSPKSGVNDAKKLLASVALFLVCRAGCLLLDAWLSGGPDPVLRSIIDAVAV